jgi:glycosyltransferase involved in cell wall biosynthesis
MLAVSPPPLTHVPSRRLRIVQVMASGRGAGGIEKHFFELCNRLCERHDVVAVAHPDHRHGLAPQVQFESLGRMIGRRNPATLFRFLQIVRKWRPEIVHAHAGRAAGIVGRLRPFTSGRLVATIHGLKRHAWDFRHIDQLIAVSRGVADRLPRRNATVIYNGIVPPQTAATFGREYLRAEFGRPFRRPVAVSIGRLDPVKGFDVLIDAWEGVEADLLIVGEGPQHRELATQVRQRRLEDRVLLTGFRRDVPTLLASADLTIIASRREGFGYTLAEALLLRQLVVSTDVPAANEILPPRYVVPCEAAAPLRDCIGSVLHDLTAARRDFQPVWDRSTGLFTIEAMVEKVDRLYGDLTRAA